MRSRWQVSPAPNAAPEVRRAAFVDYVLLLTGWRRLPYLDPGLPLEFLPQSWSGVAAEDLFADLHHALAAPARRHAEAILAASRDPST